MRSPKPILPKLLPFACFIVFHIPSSRGLVPKAILDGDLGGQVVSKSAFAKELQHSDLSVMDVSAHAGGLSTWSRLTDLMQSIWESFTNAYSLRGVREQDKQLCPRLSLNPDSQSLALQMQSGPVKTDAMLAELTVAKDRKQPHHVFISGPAHGGTTAMYNLISSSPEASNICAAKTLCCEGSWLLIKRSLMTHKNRNSPAYPRDWNEALDIFNEYWNTSKKVLVEKSPESVRKFTRIYEDLTSAGKRVSFIYVTRSPCYPPEAKVRFTFTSRLRHIVQQVAELRALGARVLVVKMEDLEHDPYGVAKQVLSFLPELQSLDPMVNSIDAEVVKQEGGERSVPLAIFANEHNFTYGLRHGEPVYSTAEERRLLRELDYPENFVQSPLL